MITAWCIWLITGLSVLCAPLSTATVHTTRTQQDTQLEEGNGTGNIALSLKLDNIEIYKKIY